MLYVTTGDSGEDKLAQDVKSTSAKILRMTLDARSGIGIEADNNTDGRGSLSASDDRLLMLKK